MIGKKLKVKKCFGRVPLKKGIRLIGIYDIIWTIIDVVLFAVALAGITTFLVPEKGLFWLMLVKFFLVDALRTVAFVLMLRFDGA